MGMFPYLASWSALEGGGPANTTDAQKPMIKLTEMWLCKSRLLSLYVLNRTVRTNLTDLESKSIYQTAIAVAAELPEKVRWVAVDPGEAKGRSPMLVETA